MAQLEKYQEERIVDLCEQNQSLREALERCRNELLGTNEYVPSDSWANGIKEAILQAEKVLGVK